MRDAIELILLIVFIVICVRACDGCSKDIHHKHGLSGLGSHIIHGDSYKHK